MLSAIQTGYDLPLTQVSWSVARIVVRTDLPARRASRLDPVEAPRAD